MATLVAARMPIPVPTAKPNAIHCHSIIPLVRSVATMAINMPTAESWLALRAETGELNRLSPTMNRVEEMM